MSNAEKFSEPSTGKGRLFIGFGFLLAFAVLLVAGLAYNAGTHRPGKDTASVSTPVAAPASTDFSPPEMSAMPGGEDGAAIKRGYQIFTDTPKYARAFAGSSLKCSNCHLDAGRQANASPMWAAWVVYPKYRSKNNQINTMHDRIHGCFVYSMNAKDSPAGKPPALDDPIYRDLEAYFAWLATGAPTGAKMKGAGYLSLNPTPQGHDIARGAKVYGEQCAACHGADGMGQKNPDGSYAYPPLWGEHSFAWGAGMSKIANAAGFIKANMPFGNGMSLTDQQSWDVAAFVVSHERPRDPRQIGTTIAATKAKFHKSGDYYGQTINGDLLGDGMTHN